MVLLALPDIVCGEHIVKRCVIGMEKRGLCFGLTIQVLVNSLYQSIS
jgi:hypothetical protein